MERTFSFVKPDSVKRGVVGEIIKRYEAAGLRIAALKKIWLTRDKAQGFYAVHSDKSFFAGLTSFMTEGPVVALVLEGDDAVDKVRAINGATDPAKAEKGTIRKDFGTNIERNAVHGSDSIDNATNEISYIFNVLEIF